MSVYPLRFKYPPVAYNPPLKLSVCPFKYKEPPVATRLYVLRSNVYPFNDNVPPLGTLNECPLATVSVPPPPNVPPASVVSAVFSVNLRAFKFKFPPVSTVSVVFWATNNDPLELAATTKLPKSVNTPFPAKVGSAFDKVNEELIIVRVLFAKSTMRPLSIDPIHVRCNASSMYTQPSR